jgi:Ni,Fe-hydrogenase III large subunit
MGPYHPALEEPNKLDMTCDFETAGEVMNSVTWKEHARNPSRVHVRTPTFANMPAIRYKVMARGLRIPR